MPVLEWPPAVPLIGKGGRSLMGRGDKKSLIEQGQGKPLIEEGNGKLSMGRGNGRLMEKGKGKSSRTVPSYA